MGRRTTGDASKLEIARLAADLFAQRGYAAVSMEDICRTTGRSKGSIYYHFKSKEDLFFYILDMKMRDWREAWMEKSAALTSVTDKLYLLADHYTDDFAHPLTRAADEFVAGQALGEEKLQEALALIQSSYGLYEALIREGIERGELRQDDPRDLMIVLNGMLGGLGTLYFETDMAEIKRLYRKAVDLFLHGAAART